MIEPGSGPAAGKITMPEDRISLPSAMVTGFQHVVAMFGGTVLCPLLIGFDANVAVFFSGIATLLFLVLVKGRVPSYLGSSFSFIAAIITVTGYSGSGPNPNIGLALGGIVACGVVYALIGLLVMKIGYGWIEKLMPPVVTGTIVAVIGLNLASVGVKDISASTFTILMGLMTIVLVASSSVFLPGFLSRLPILIGGIIAYGLYYLITNIGHWGAPIDFTALQSAAWVGVPKFSTPVFELRAALVIAPVALILVAENLGHVRAIAAMTGRSMDEYLGRAFLGDGLGTILAGFFGGTGVTTYAENMGVMAITRNFSYRTFIAAGLIAVVFGLSPKFGALINTIPVPVVGGLSFVVFGLITATAGRIWVENRVDFTDPKNLLVVGVATVMGAGNLTVQAGDFAFGGIAMATFSTLLLYHFLALRKDKPQA